MVNGQLTLESSQKLDEVDGSTNLTNTVAPTVFTSNLLVAAVNDDNEMAQGDFPMIADVAYAVAMCESVTGKQKRVN